MNGMHLTPGFKVMPRPYRVPVSLPIVIAADHYLYGTVKNISAGGLYIESDRVLNKGRPVTFDLDLKNGRRLRSLQGIVVHSHPTSDKKEGVGFQFDSLAPQESEILEGFLLSQLPTGMLYYEQERKRIAPAPGVLEIKDFKLLIGGEDVDTGLYDYVPYADKLIADFFTTYDKVLQLKDGKIPEDYRQHIYGRYSIGSSEHNLKAMEAAWRAGLYFRDFPIQRRRKIMDAVHDLMVAHKDELIELMVVEGHPIKLAEWQVDGMCRGYGRNTVDFYASELSKSLGGWGREELHLIRRPDGVVAVCAPGNAPCSNSLLACWAILSGNAVIVKPPIKNPISTMFLWRNIIFEAAKIYGAPEGLINIIVGDSKQIVNEWIESKHVNDLLYFGDSKLGLEIGKKAYAVGKKPILELSGNDLMMIWKDAELNGTMDALIEGFLGSTQICMVPKKALIHEEIFDEVAERFIARAKTLKIGLPTDPEVLLSPVMKIDTFYEFLEDAKSKGAKVECGGRRINHLGELDDNGMYIEPMVLRIDDLSAALTMRCVQEENFFPMIPLIKIKATEKSKDADTEIFLKMMEVLEQNDYGLRASVWVQSEKMTQRFIDLAHNSGLLRINSKHVAFSELIGTHGGTKMSGGPFGEMNYLWQKTTHLQGVSVTRPLHS